MTARKDTMSRKYLVTINNPAEKGYTHESIKAILSALQAQYWCLADEVGQQQATAHIHVFLYRKSAWRFSTITRHFPGGHVDTAKGTCVQVRDYIGKTGEWESSEKALTAVQGTFEEGGELPQEHGPRAGNKADSPGARAEAILADIRAGLSDIEMFTRYPRLMYSAQTLAMLREAVNKEQFLNEQREVTVYYIFGPAGIGKTRYIFDLFPAKDICRITEYERGRVQFDSYHGQPVLVFEEFTDSVGLTSLLNWIDRYPVYLPARYSDRIACFNTVFFTSNLPLSMQYEDIQRNKPEIWRAFLRRINHIIEFLPDGSQVEHKTSEYK